MTMQNTIIEGHNQRLETIPKFIVKYLTSGIPDETSSIHREAASPEMRSHPGRCLAIAASHPPSILSDCKKALAQQARISTRTAPSIADTNSRISATAGAVYLPKANTEGGAAGYNRGRAPRHREHTRLSSKRVSPQKNAPQDI